MYDLNDYLKDVSDLCLYLNPTCKTLTDEIYKYEFVPSNTNCRCTLSFHQEKENQMVQITTLLKLADQDFKKELAGVGGLPLEIQDALKEQMAEEKKNRAKAAATQIVELYRQADQHVENGVAQIRELRRQVEAVKTHLGDVALTKEYGIATSNFLPLARVLGMLSPRDMMGIDAKLLSVPADFKAGAKKVARSK